jgi:hypothetical protein
LDILETQIFELCKVYQLAALKDLCHKHESLNFTFRVEQSRTLLEVLAIDYTRTPEQITKFFELCAFLYSDALDTHLLLPSCTDLFAKLVDICSQYDHILLFKYLSENISDPFLAPIQLNTHDQITLHLILEHGATSILRYLVEEAPKSIHLRTQLADDKTIRSVHHAIEVGRLETVQYILEKSTAFGQLPISINRPANEIARWLVMYEDVDMLTYLIHVAPSFGYELIDLRSVQRDELENFRESSPLLYSEIRFLQDNWELMNFLSTQDREVLLHALQDTQSLESDVSRSQSKI